MASKNIFGTSCTINAVTTLFSSTTLWIGNSGDSGSALAIDPTGNLWILIKSSVNTQAQAAVIPVSTGTIFGSSVTANTVNVISGTSLPEISSGAAIAALSTGSIIVSYNAGNYGIAATSTSLFGTSVSANTWTSLTSITGSATHQMITGPGNVLYSGYNGIQVLSPSVTTILGTAVAANTWTIITGTDVGGDGSYSPALDSNGNLFFIDAQSFNLYVVPSSSGTLFGVSVTANTASKIIVAPSGITSCQTLTVDSSNNVYALYRNSSTGAYDLYVLANSSGTIFGTVVTANVWTELFASVAPTESASPQIVFDSSGDLFIYAANELSSSGTAGDLYVIAGQSAKIPDVPQINPGPTWLAHFKPGLAKPKPPVPPSFINMVTTSGSAALAPMTVSEASAYIIQSDVPSIRPGPTWLAIFKRGYRPRPPLAAAPPSGPYYGNLPNTADIPQINPGPAWIDHFKPGIPKSRPQNIPSTGVQNPGSVQLAPMGVSGTATVYPVASGGPSLAPMGVSGTVQVPIIVTGQPALAPMSVSGTVHVPVITNGSAALAPMEIVTPSFLRDLPHISPGPSWLDHFKPGLGKTLRIPGNPQYIGSQGSIALAAMKTASTVTVYLPFPQFPMTLKFELLINGTWLDVTSYVYQRDNIVITRGLPDETQSATPSQMTCTLNNRDGRFSPNNPSGAYYPYLTRNVQMRCSVVNQASENGTPYNGYRFWGEVSSWPPQWDNTQTDIYCQIIVSGVLRRYVQGAALGSTLKQYYTSLTGNFTPYAYWPCEDGSSATELASALPSDPSMTFTGTPSLSSSSAFGGSDALPDINGSTWSGATGGAADPPGTGSITQLFPGTYTWTCPPGVTQVTSVVVTGAGGGGGDQNTTIGGGGGGGGGVGKSSSVSVTAGNTYTYVVGTGGAAGSSSGGGNGSNSMFTGDTQTITGVGGTGGSYGGSGGAGGVGGTYTGGSGASGQSSSSYNAQQQLNGNAGATGGGTDLTVGGVTQSWGAPNSVTSVTVQAWGGGGGGGGGQGAGGGGGGGGGGGYSGGTIDVTPGNSYTFQAGNGGAGGSQDTYGNTGGNSQVSGDSSSVEATGGERGAPNGGGGGGGTPNEGSGNSGGPGGNAANTTSAYGGGGGGGGSNGGPNASGGAGSAANERAPGAGSGSGGKGGWGKILTGSGAGSGQTAGQTGNQGSGIGGGGGGGGATNDVGGGSGTSGGGGGPGAITWSYTVTGQPTGGAGGGAAGTNGNGSGQTPGAGGGEGGSPGVAGSSPGGGGGGGVPDNGGGATNPGAGSAGAVSFAWSGGATSPVPSDVVRFCLDIDSAGSEDGAVLMSIETYGTVATANVIYHTGGNLELIGYNASSGQLFDSGSLAVGADGTPLYIDVELVSSGSSVNWVFQGIEPGAGSTTFHSSGSVTGSVGNVSNIIVDPVGGVTDSGTVIGQITVQEYADTIVNLSPIVAGYTGETAAARIARLCASQGIAFTLEGQNADTPQMGPQQDDTFVNIIQSCADFDRGQIFETRNQFGIGYRTRVNMQGQSPVLNADYSLAQLAGTLQPTADDQYTRNDITVTRNGGASSRAQLSTGAMSVLTPPNGVGDYSYSLTVQAYTDGQLSNMVSWMLTVGTVSEYRYPTIMFDMSRTEVAGLFTIIPTMDIGDYLQVANPPNFLQAGPINQLFWGVTETLNAYTWTISINTVPESPYSEGQPPTW